MSPFETIPPTKIEQGKRRQELFPLHRGIWAETLKNNQNLPLGGSMFSDELTLKLQLDFNSFEDQLRSYTPENFRAVYEKQKESVETWMKTANISFDSYVFFVCHQIQQKVAILLEVDKAEEETRASERMQMYIGKNTPRLSEMKGVAACAERAALAQYLLQKVGIDSVYMSGVTMRDIHDEDEYPEQHSFVILENIPNEKGRLIFDIARSHSDNIPRIMRPGSAMDYDMLKDQEEMLIGATDIISQGGKLWFGVGEPIAGYHKESV